MIHDTDPRLHDAVAADNVRRMLAGTLTAWLAGRGAAQRNAVRSVKDDW
jgi:hypothetical protein